jgi:hypothetical protein
VQLGITPSAVHTKAAKMMAYYHEQRHPIPRLFVNAEPY